MGFLHAMACHTAGIQRTAPVRWRSYDAMCGVFWEAEGKAGATGYYRSPDPRVMLFFNDVSGHIGMSERGAVDDLGQRPLLRAVYVPAGMPMWTKFHADHRFSHLDLHLKRSWLLDRLTPALGSSEAASVLQRPTESQEVAEIAAIGAALKDEVCTSARHPFFAESLAVSLLAGLLDLPRAEDRKAPPSGGLTPAQMRRLNRLLDSDAGRRLTNADLADAVGLSPSWFARAFKKTTGKTPLHWQHEHRIELVKRALQAGNVMIADVSTQFGFADQAHLTRVFRQVTGTTPAAWLRENRAR